MECDICGDEMEDSDGASLEGITISVTSIPEDGPPHPEYQKLIDTFGKSKFSVCFTCWIKALGVKPIKFNTIVCPVKLWHWVQGRGYK